jgi:hypothetical protein
MQLSKDIQSFSSSCERLLATGAVYRPLTKDEMDIIEYYCKELLQKVVPPK